MTTVLLIIGLLISVVSSGQEPATDFIADAKTIDFSDLWTNDSILIGNEILIERRQPLGFIGDDFQRINIRFVSVIQNPDNKLEYFVFGKSRVKDNVCDFQGTLKITGSELYKMSEWSDVKQGYISGNYKFYEDKDQIHTGFFSGQFITRFYFDKDGNLKYDALSFAADGFKNNQFEGTWTYYQTGDSRKCNWGDYRIPGSGDLDLGAAEFGPSKKYDDSGWKDYNLAWEYRHDSPQVKEARMKETEKWWQDCE